MSTQSEHYTIKISTINTPKQMPLMEIKIFGKPGLSEILGLMKHINAEIDNIKGDYISVTDLSELDINKLLGSIILRSMESTYKSLVSVKRPAILSFVVMGDKDYHAVSITETLDSVNQAKAQSKDYKYNYVFVKKIEEVEAIAKNILSKK